MPNSSEVLSFILEALQGLNLPVVVMGLDIPKNHQDPNRVFSLSADSTTATNLVDNAISKSAYIPHELIFPRCSLVIHHGGCGTVCSAISAGVPQVVIPCYFDQFAWGDRIEHLGIGASPGSAVCTTASSIKSAIERARGAEVLEQVKSYRSLLRKERKARTAIVGVAEDA